MSTKYSTVSRSWRVWVICCAMVTGVYVTVRVSCGRSLHFYRIYGLFFNGGFILVSHYVRMHVGYTGRFSWTCAFFNGGFIFVRHYVRM